MPGSRKYPYPPRRFTENPKGGGINFKSQNHCEQSCDVQGDLVWGVGDPNQKHPMEGEWIDAGITLLHCLPPMQMRELPAGCFRNRDN